MFVQHDMKAKTKSDDEDDQEKTKLGDSLENLEEHDNVETHVGELSQVRCEVEPGTSDQE